MISETISILTLSLVISGTATILGCCWCLPIAFKLCLSPSKISSAIISIFNALIGVPTTIIGLVLYFMFSSRGPLGFLGLLYTPQAIIIGQAILITPLLVSLLYEVFRKAKETYFELALSLGADKWQAFWLMLSEMKYEILSVVLISFNRAIGELGVALIVGGNIRGYTRVMTTAIALELSKGNFQVALVLGLYLFLIVLSISLTVHLIRGLRE